MLVHSHEYPPVRGGAGVYSAQLVAALNKIGCKVWLLTREGEQPELGFGGCVGVSRFGNSAPVRVGWRLWWLAVRQRIDIVILADPGSVEEFAVLPPPFLPYALVVHGTEVWQAFHPEHRVLNGVGRARLTRLFKRASVLVHSSDAGRRCLEECKVDLPRSLRKVYPAVDRSGLHKPTIEDLERLKRLYGISGGPVVVCVARLGVDKGQDVLLRAVPGLLEHFPDLRVILGGDGEKRQELESLALRLGIDSSVVFAGEVSEQDKVELLELSTVFVMASRCRDRFEGFGIVYVEAALCCRASIGGKEGGVPEAILDGVTGLLVDADDPMDVADAIHRFLANEQMARALGENAFRRAMEKFSPEKMAESMGEVVRDLAEDEVGMLRFILGAIGWSVRLSVLTGERGIGAAQRMLRGVWSFFSDKAGSNALDDGGSRRTD
ncbi:MAG: glycosyltransferase family 4 protein [bacterium]|nr:glycosyltransferase family 4 protein [bacterium]